MSQLRDDDLFRSLHPRPMAASGCGERTGRARGNSLRSADSLEFVERGTWIAGGSCSAQCDGGGNRSGDRWNLSRVLDRADLVRKILTVTDRRSARIAEWKLQSP